MRSVNAIELNNYCSLALISLGSIILITLKLYLQLEALRKEIFSKNSDLLVVRDELNAEKDEKVRNK